MARRPFRYLCAADYGACGLAVLLAMAPSVTPSRASSTAETPTARSPREGERSVEIGGQGAWSVPVSALLYLHVTARVSERFCFLLSLFFLLFPGARRDA